MSRSSGRERSPRCSCNWASQRSASVGHTANTATPMGAGRQSRFTPAATSRRHCCGRSRRTSGFRSKNSSPGDEHVCAHDVMSLVAGQGFEPRPKAPTTLFQVQKPRLPRSIRPGKSPARREWWDLFSPSSWANHRTISDAQDVIAGSGRILRQVVRNFHPALPRSRTTRRVPARPASPGPTVVSRLHLE